MKKTWRAAELAPAAAAALASGRSVTATAKALGLDRGTVHRWRRSGRLAALTPPARRPQPVASLSPPTFDLVTDRSQTEKTSPIGEVLPPSPESWAASVHRLYRMSKTDEELVLLGEAALVLAKDATATPAARLLASARFQAIVKQLRLMEQG